MTETNAPLVLFLDDMQWADSATLVMLETLLTDAEGKGLLVIAAYRDNETPPEHPLWRFVEATEKHGAKVRRMTVGPLSEAEVQLWLGKTLQSDPERCAPLASVLWQKTSGTPFFLEQLLLALHRQKQVLRDPQTGQWHFNLAELSRAQVTDNVVTLLTDKVGEMPETTRQLLGLAACAGFTFRIQDLSRLSGWGPAQITAALWPALREELVVPAGAGARQLVRGGRRCRVPIPTRSRAAGELPTDLPRAAHFGASSHRPAPPFRVPARGREPAAAP